MLSREEINLSVWDKEIGLHHFMDPALEESTMVIGYLGTHADGAFSDHVYAYVGFDEESLFLGQINWPVDVHLREFMIEQRDSEVEFIKEDVGAFDHLKK